VIVNVLRQVIAVNHLRTRPAAFNGIFPISLPYLHLFSGLRTCLLIQYFSLIRLQLAMEKKVYQDTTRPLPRVSRARYYNKHDKSDLGDDFVAPDAGWAWIVCVAAGVSNVGKTKPISSISMSNIF